MKKIIIVLLFIGLITFVGCKTESEYDVLNKVFDFSKNSEYTGYNATIETVLGENEAIMEIDKTNNIIRYYEKTIKLEEFGQGNSESSFTETEEFYANNLRYFQENNTWKTEAKTFHLQSIMQFKEEYFEQVSTNKDETTSSFTGKVKDESTVEFVGKECSNLTITVIYNNETFALKQILLAYTNSFENAVSAKVVVNYEPCSLQLPVVQ